MTNDLGKQKNTGIYTLAHGFPETTELNACVRMVQKVCGENGVKGKYSNMGVHMTLLPPFYADAHTIRLMAIAMKVANTPIGKKQGSFQVTGLEYFTLNEETMLETVHLTVLLPQAYLELITWLKANNTFEWVYPHAQSTPVEPVFVPHVHIMEGNNLKRRISRFSHSLDDKLRKERFSLTPPTFFQKHESTSEERGRVVRWTQVVV